MAKRLTWVTSHATLAVAFSRAIPLAWRGSTPRAPLETLAWRTQWQPRYCALFCCRLGFSGIQLRNFFA